VTVTWRPPQYDGGAPIGSYLVYDADRGLPQRKVGAATTSVTFTGVAPGAEYRFVVRTSGHGGMTETMPSNTVTPT